ncbi:MAG: hypothetical protein K6T57_15700 [Thermaceae bacterium]|nr:hypothetical protein [Thermaceae bacterium]
MPRTVGGSSGMLTKLSKPPVTPQINFLAGTVEPTKGLHIIKVYAPTAVHEYAFGRIAKLATTWDLFTARIAASWRGPNGLRVRFPRSAVVAQNGKKVYLPRKGYESNGKYFYFLVEFY